MIPICADGLPLEQLVDYVAGELSAEREKEVEEHYFTCAACTERAEALLRLGEGVRTLVLRGRVSAAVSEAFLQRLERQGLRVRRYRLKEGESVACTAAPEDDFVSLCMELPQLSSETVDVQVEWTDLRQQISEERKVEDTALDAQGRSLVMLFSATQIREFPRSRWRMHVTPRSQTGQRTLGPYLLEHTPWEELHLPE